MCIDKKTGKTKECEVIGCTEPSHNKSKKCKAHLKQCRKIRADNSFEMLCDPSHQGFQSHDYFTIIQPGTKTKSKYKA